MEKLLIGIDIGTTGTKSLLINEHGEMIAYAYSGYSLTTPMLNRHEQNALDWWKAVVKTVGSLMNQSGKSHAVCAISLSTQGGTLVLTDEKLRPLRPAIVWSDTRCEQERQAFELQFGPRYMYEKSGWHLSRGLNALQLAWLGRHEPEIFRQAEWILSVHDYISFKLTGKPVIDMSNAGINQLADIRKGQYDPSILEFSGIKENQLPQIVSSGTPIAHLTQGAADELGLPQDTVFVCGAHDQYAALLGAGAAKTSDILIGSGTAWVVTVLADHPDFSSGFSQSLSAVADKWGMLVSLQTGGVCLDWLMKNIISPPSQAQGVDYDFVNQKAAEIEPGSDGLMFFPYLNGAVFPVADVTSKASFLGLDLSHDKRHLTRAVLEGVTGHISWIIDHFRAHAGLGTLMLSGGAAKSRLWCQMLADMTNQAVHLPMLPDLACVGAAILAGAGSGVFKDTAQGCSLFSARETIISPNPSAVQLYAQFQSVYRLRAKELGALYRL